MESNIRFQNDYVLYAEEYENLKDKIFELIKEELPKEAQTYEIISYIFNELNEDLKFISVSL